MTDQRVVLVAALHSHHHLSSRPHHLSCCVARLMTTIKRFHPRSRTLRLYAKAPAHKYDPTTCGLGEFLLLISVKGFAEMTLVSTTFPPIPHSECAFYITIEAWFVNLYLATPFSPLRYLLLQ